MLSSETRGKSSLVIGFDECLLSQEMTEQNKCEVSRIKTKAECQHFNV